jgi:hypothetical protein
VTAAIRPISTGRQWADRPAVDTRVSRAEQDDRQIPMDEPASFWMLALWVSSPFLAIVLGIVASLLSR